MATDRHWTRRVTNAMKMHSLTTITSKTAAMETANTITVPLKTAITSVNLDKTLYKQVVTVHFADAEAELTTAITNGKASLVTFKLMPHATDYRHDLSLDANINTLLALTPTKLFKSGNIDHFQESVNKA